MKASEIREDDDKGNGTGVRDPSSYRKRIKAYKKR